MKKYLAVFLMVTVFLSSISSGLAAPSSPSIGFLLWEENDYTLWEKDSGRLDAEESVHLYTTDDNEHYSMIFTSKESYQRWLSTLDESSKEAIESISYEISGKNLPSEIQGIRTMSDQATRDSDVESISLNTDTTYIIVPRGAILCTICTLVVTSLGWYVLNRYVYDPFFDWLDIELELMGECANDHRQSMGDKEITSQCTYISWCGGTSATVVADYGTYAECACSCGALWNAPYS